MKRAMSCVIALALAVLVAGNPPAPAPARAGGVVCHDVNVAVTVLLLPQTMFGRLCEPATPSRTVLVLVPGATYTGDYWDLPAQLGLYSFRAGMNNDGYATLVVDRLGSGRSSHPLSATLTALVQADAVHQVIQRLRAGTLGSGYDKVIVGGHSLGGGIAVLEAATFQDVDGVLMAAISHHFDAVATANLFLTMHPAMLDPQLMLRGYDPGYLTTEAGTRAEDFHAPGIPTIPAINHDESTKDVFSPTEAVDALGVGILTPYSALVTVPVLMAVGSNDELMCGPLPPAADCTSAGTVRAQEVPYFSPAAQLEVFQQPGYGHSFNYAPNANLFQQVVTDWANRKVGH